MKDYLIIAQIVIPILLIVSILIQQRGTALGSAFGGQGGGGFYSTRRGIQKKIFIASIILGILFIAVSFLNLVI
jgi:protein translocase SecG subunit